MIKRSIAFWLLIASVGLFLLQLIPITGLFLMFMGAGFVNALLIYLFLVALFVEGVIGRLPRIVAIIPVVAVGAWYWAYQEQHRLLAEETPKLKSINVGKVMDFDPSTQSLVFDDAGTNMVEYFVAHNRIPVAYAGDLAARLVPASQCSTMTSFHNGALAWVQSIQTSKLLTGETALCMLSRHEAVEKTPVHIRQVDHATPGLKRLGISEPSTDVVVNGKVVGELRKIVMNHIPPYPWFVGCGLIDNPAAWVCATSFFEERQQVINSDPPSGADKRLDERVDILLGIAKYTNDEITHFTGYPENALIVLLAQSPEAPPKLTPFEPAPPSHISK